MTHTIVLTEEAVEQYRKVCNVLADADYWLATSSWAFELAERRALVDRMRLSFHIEWGARTGVHNLYDGTLRITADVLPLSFHFWYEGSGLQGGIIFHRNPDVTDALIGEWSSHT